MYRHRHTDGYAGDAYLSVYLGGNRWMGSYINVYMVMTDIQIDRLFSKDLPTCLKGVQSSSYKSTPCIHWS